MLELRSRILGLTALNAELTRKIQSGVDETVAMKALESRNAELQKQLGACNKDISGLQVCADSHVCICLFGAVVTGLHTCTHYRDAAACV